VEAGVDVSFSHVYREMCPLDNIVQVMGRLNREGKDPDAQIIVFETDGDRMPYLELDMQESRKRIQHTVNSEDLYETLSNYYADISSKNTRNVSLVMELDDYVSRLDFAKTWDFVNRHVFAEDDQDTVFIPNDDEWEEVRKSLLNNDVKNSFKKFGLISASLPAKANLPKNDFFDSMLLEKGILLPKRERLSEIYDKNLGLDVWLIRE
jgi:hypothetical protein